MKKRFTLAAARKMPVISTKMLVQEKSFSPVIGAELLARQGVICRTMGFPKSDKRPKVNILKKTYKLLETLNGFGCFNMPELLAFTKNRGNYRDCLDEAGFISGPLLLRKILINQEIYAQQLQAGERERLRHEVPKAFYGFVDLMNHKIRSEQLAKRHGMPIKAKIEFAEQERHIRDIGKKK